MKCLSLIIVLFFSPNILAKCLDYEPSVSTISGVLVKETFAGRPNYSSLAEGDEIESYFFIKTSVPFCVRAKPNELLNESRQHIKIVQLVFLSNSQAFYDSLRSRLGGAVACTGTLFSANTAHHRSKVLLSVNECAK